MAAQTPTKADSHVRSRLGTEKLLPLLVKFSVPAIIGMLVNALYNIVDRLFVGRTVGELGLAAITVNFPISMIMGASSIIVGVGANALFAIRMGEGNQDEAEKVFGNASMLLLAVPLVMGLVMAAAIDPILITIGANENTLSLARSYTLICLCGSPFSSFSHGMTHFIRTDGHPQIAMGSQLLGAIVNIILDAWFVMGFKWGVNGAALATSLAQLFTTVYVTVYFRSSWSTITLHKKNLRPEWRRIVFPFLFLGLPQFVMSVAHSAINAVMNKSLDAYGGSLATAAMGIVMSANTVLLMPLMGVSQGAQPIIGFNFGARKFDRVIRTYWLGAAGCTIYAVITLVITLIFAGPIASIFIDDNAALLELSTHALRVINVMIPIIGIQIMTSVLLQSTGRPLLALIIGLSRQVIILIPLILVMPHLVTALFSVTLLDGLWSAWPTSDFLAACVSIPVALNEIRNLRAGRTKFKFTTDQPVTDDDQPIRMPSSAPAPIASATLPPNSFPPPEI